MLHGTSTATVTTTWNLPSNVATRLKLGMLARRIGVGSSPVSPFQMDLVFGEAARFLGKETYGNPSDKERSTNPLGGPLTLKTMGNV